MSKCQDLEDGEQCLNMAKSDETLVEARSDTDVTIVRETWVQGRGCLCVCFSGVCFWLCAWFFVCRSCWEKVFPPV